MALGTTRNDTPPPLKHPQFLPLADDLAPLEDDAAVLSSAERHSPEEQRAWDLENLAVELSKRAAELQEVRSLFRLMAAWPDQTRRGEGGGIAEVMVTYRRIYGTCKLNIPCIDPGGVPACFGGRKQKKLLHYRQRERTARAATVA